MKLKDHEAVKAMVNLYADLVDLPERKILDIARQMLLDDPMLRNQLREHPSTGMECRFTATVTIPASTVQKLLQGRPLDLICPPVVQQDRAGVS